MPYFSTKICLFYTRHIPRQFVVKNDFVRAREDVRANFWFQFFDILKYVKYVFQNKESICSQSQNTTPV
jgi:hypothetical protein